MVPGLKGLEYKDRLEKANIPSMRYRRERGDMVEVYKYVHGHYNKPAPFSLENSDRTRGHSLKIKKNRVYTNLRQNFFTYRIVDKWNNLPEEVVNSSTLNGFKNGLDRTWKEHKYM